MDDEQMLELLTQITELAGMGIDAITGGAAEQGPPPEGEEPPAEEPPA